MFRMFIAKDTGRLWWDRAKLRIPLIGPVLASRFYAQFAASLGNLVNNGIPLLNALRLTTKTTTNVFLRGLLSKATVHIGEGVSLSGALRKVGELPVLLVDMVAMGEQTGRLGKSLEKIAMRYDKELDAKVSRLTALITPVVLIFLFVIVGIVALAVVTAIFDAFSNVRPG
jgi:general secretion pathway protein F/type IV pilus assembly protein PilC